MLNSEQRSKKSSNIKRSFKRNERGYSLLELATVIFPLLILVVGAIDVTKVVQSYRALSEGVETALRCAYPVNGECQQVSAEPPAALFNWYRFANVPTVWGDSFFYGSYVNTLRQPQFEIDSFNAEILSSITYSIPAYRHTAVQNFYQAEAEVVPVVVMTAARPIADISSPGDIDFYYDHDPNNPNSIANEKYKAAFNLLRDENQRGNSNNPNRRSETSLSINGDQSVSRTIRINIPAPVEAGPESICYTSKTMNNALKEGSAHEIDYKSPCPPNYWREGDVVIWIKGSTNGTDSNSTAVLDLDYNNSGARKPPAEDDFTSLGGVEFTGGGDGSLVGRGAGKKHVRGKKYEESEIYKRVRVKYGEPTYLNLTLRRSLDSEKSKEGNATWSLDNVFVFAPQFEVRGERGTFGCENNLLKSTPKNDVSACKLSVEGAVKSWDFVSPEKPIDSTELASAKTLEATDKRQKDPCIDIVKSGHSPSMQACDVDFAFSSTLEILKDQKQICDPKTIPSVPYGTEDEIRAILESGKICQVERTVANGEHFDASPTRTITGWAFTTTEVKLDKPLRWTPKNCSTPKPIISSGAQGYHRIISTGDSKPLESTPQAILVTTEEPSKFRKANDYECRDFNLSDPIHFNKDTKSDEPDSFFAKPQADLGGNFEEDVRRITYGEGIGRDAYVHVDERIKDKPIQLPGIPSDPSISYWFSDTQDLGEKTIVTGSPFPNGTVPEICKDPSSFCKAELESLPAREEADFEFLMERAELIGYQEMQIAYPSARPGCDEPGCVNLELSPSDDGTNMINARATMKVPLGVLFGNDIEISFESSERWEGHFAR